MALNLKRTRTHMALRHEKVSLATRTSEAIWVRTQRKRRSHRNERMLVGERFDLCATDPKVLAERGRNEGAKPHMSGSSALEHTE